MLRLTSNQKQWKIYHDDGTHRWDKWLLSQSGGAEQIAILDRYNVREHTTTQQKRK